MNPTEVHEQLVAALRAAQELMIAMETCHICKGAILLQETPVYCEDCSFDCEEHEEPECPTIQSLHFKANRLTKMALRAAGEGIE